MDREAWCAAIHGVAELDMTERLNWTENPASCPLSHLHIRHLPWGVLPSVGSDVPWPLTFHHPIPFTSIGLHLQLSLAHSLAPHLSIPNIRCWVLMLGWCKINCGFALLNFAVWYWNTFLNKCNYMFIHVVIHHFNVHFSLCVFFFFLLMTLLAI